MHASTPPRLSTGSICDRQLFQKYIGHLYVERVVLLLSHCAEFIVRSCCMAFPMFLSHSCVYLKCCVVCVFAVGQLNSSITFCCSSQQNIQIFFACEKESAKFSVGLEPGADSQPILEEMVRYMAMLKRLKL